MLYTGLTRRVNPRIPQSGGVAGVRMSESVEMSAHASAWSLRGMFRRAYWVLGPHARRSLSLSLWACFVNTTTLNAYVSKSYTGLTRRNTLFMFLWLRHRKTWISIQHVGLTRFRLDLYNTLLDFKASVHELFIRILPSRPASPTLLHYYCTTIAHVRPPIPRPSLRMPCTIQYW